MRDSQTLHRSRGAFAGWPDIDARRLGSPQTIRPSVVITQPVIARRLFSAACPEPVEGKQSPVAQCGLLRSLEKHQAARNDAHRSGIWQAGPATYLRLVDNNLRFELPRPYLFRWYPL